MPCALSLSVYARASFTILSWDRAPLLSSLLSTHFARFCQQFAPCLHWQALQFWSWHRSSNSRLHLTAPPHYRYLTDGGEEERECGETKVCVVCHLLLVSCSTGMEMSLLLQPAYRSLEEAAGGKEMESRGL